MLDANSTEINVDADQSFQECINLDACMPVATTVSKRSSFAMLIWNVVWAEI